MSDISEAVESTDELPDDLRVSGDDNPDMGPGFDLEAHNAKAAEATGQAPAEEPAEAPAEAPGAPSPAADTNGASEPPAEPQGAAEPA